MKQYNIHKLKNNLTVIICHYPNFNSLYFDLAIKVGSRYENKDNNGLSHLAEHLLQKKAINSLKKHPWIKHYINNNFR
ncbi:MAG: insulinase family protein, partial [Candidatus Parcubacteria bacterium]|nr:insulinase family protein [Candidatus Parcubacteria bacterium]